MRGKGGIIFNLLILFPSFDTEFLWPKKYKNTKKSIFKVPREIFYPLKVAYFTPLNL